MLRIKALVKVYLPNDTCQIEKTVQLATICLRVVGFDYLSQDRPKSYKIFSLLFVAFNVFVLVAGCNGFLQADSIDLKVNCIISSCFAIMIMVKLFEMVQQQKLMKEILRISIKQTKKYEISGGRERLIGVENKKIANKILMFQLVTFLFTGVTIPAAFVISQGKTCFLLVPGTDKQKWRDLMANFNLSCMAATLVTIGYLGYDLLLSQISTFLVMQIDILTYLASKIGDFTTEYVNESQQRKLIINIIKMHRDVIYFGQICNKFYRNNIFLTYVSNSINLCAIVLAVKLNTYAYSSLLSVALLGNLFILAYFGECVNTSSEQYAQQIYCSKWYLLRSIDSRRMVLLTLQMSQKTIGIEFSKFGFLTLVSFGDVIRRIYSFVTFIEHAIRE